MRRLITNLDWFLRKKVKRSLDLFQKLLFKKDFAEAECELQSCFLNIRMIWNHRGTTFRTHWRCNQLCKRLFPLWPHWIELEDIGSKNNYKVTEINQNYASGLFNKAKTIINPDDLRKQRKLRNSNRHRWRLCDAHYYLAKLYLKGVATQGGHYRWFKETTKASYHLNKVIEINPKHHQAYYNLARIH